MSTFRFENPDMAPVSRATWAACQARIAELEADVDRNLGLRREAEARLAAVVAQCDYSLGVDCPTRADIVLIRAAATRGTT